MRTISKKEYDKIVTKQKQNTVIEFYAPWCEPCSEMADILYEVRIGKTLEFYKVNTDAEHELTYENAVMSIPTVIYYKSGKPQARTIGVHPREDIEAKIKEIYD